MKNQTLYVVIATALLAFFQLSHAGDPIRVACVGDSITYGFGIKPREKRSYPAQLQDLLGDQWLVGNFGKNGATVLKKGHAPYWKAPQFKAARKFMPDVVIIKLGTNDTRPQNIGKHKSEFVADYVELIRTFQNLKSKPEVWICYPVPMYVEIEAMTDAVLVSEIIPLVTEVARQAGVEVIDLNMVLSDQAKLFSDGLHPNAEGAGVIAKTVATVIEKKKIVSKRPLDRRFAAPGLVQTPDSIARQEQWFRDAKYGAFIHFGVYSELAGEYNGLIPDMHYSEWILASSGMSVEEYHEVARGFNPSEFDADAWAKVFKDAGLQYVVITSKHHDGFALFDSEVSDYNIVDYTPFKRDIIKELSEACKKQGLKFGVYYSQAQDWDEPNAPFANKLIKRHLMHPDLPKNFRPNINEYLANKSLPQVEELMKQYEIDLIWFDTAVSMTFERAKPFSDVVRKYRPDCLINSRLIHRGKARIQPKELELFDYVSIGDKEVPNTKLPLYVETPDSVSTSFGYKSKGHHPYHTEEELIHRFVSTVCAGGNYLLNNGPMGNGKLDPEAVRLYGVIGDWLKINGEAIYNTRRNPLPDRPNWGNCTVSKDGKTLYLHILKWPDSGSITLNGVPAMATAASFLANGEPADLSQEGESLKITLPAKALDPYATVVKLAFDVNIGEKP